MNIRGVWLALAFVGMLLLLNLIYGRYNMCDNCIKSETVDESTIDIGGDNAPELTITQENWTPPDSVPDYVQSLDQTDPKLAEYISQHWLLPPSTLPRNLTRETRRHYSQGNHSERVDELLKGKENGFFIECGAHDGETFSNSLFFEKTRNWTGVLIEPGDFFPRLRLKHRHSYLLNVCLSLMNQPMRASFRLAGVFGGLSNYLNDKRMEIINHFHKVNRTVIIQCFPLFSILQAIGVTHVDYFSLDIETGEPEVVENLPLDKMTVDVFMIEYNFDKEKLRKIKATLVDKHGYLVVREDGQDVTLKRNNLFL